MRKHTARTTIGIVIGVAAGFCILSAALFVFLKLKGDKINGGKDSVSGSYIPTLEDLKNRRYIGDVVYTEPIKYPELYDYPFRKTEYYVRNKDLKADKEAIADVAMTFISELYGTGYREIMASPEAYRDNLLSYIDPDGHFYSEFGYFDEKSDIDSLSEYLVTNRVNAENVLITNNSLVYEDGTYWVRGMIETTVFNADEDITGTSTTMVDIALKNAPDTDHKYQICQIQVVDTGGKENEAQAEP